MFQVSGFPHLSIISFSGGWEPFVPLKFYIKHTPSSSLIHLKGWENGREKFNERIIDGSSESLKRGRIGAFVHSQANVRWSNLRYRFKKSHILIKFDLLILDVETLLKLWEI